MLCIPNLGGASGQWPRNISQDVTTNYSLPEDLNASQFLLQPGLLNSSVSHGSIFKPDPALKSAKEILSIIVPAICIFGLVGNSLTLLVLTRKRLKSSCDGTERTVNVGLLALAASDLLCCLCLLPPGLFQKQTPITYPSISFQLIYRAYGEAFVNTFILTSTWLTVTMATSRYLAICHPFRARHLVDLNGTRVSIMLVFIGSIVFNIPKFLYAHIEAIPCNNHYMYIFSYGGYMSYHRKAHFAYVWVYFTVGIFLPLTMLAFCNICLVKALRESSKLRKRYRVPAAHVDSNYRITSILVTIVVMYIVLVSPCEILRFLNDRLSMDRILTWAIGIEITNIFQTINFACNFVLYYILNIHFRSAMKDLFLTMWCCKCLQDGKNDRRRSRPLNAKASLSRNPSNTTNTFV